MPRKKSVQVDKNQKDTLKLIVESIKAVAKNSELIETAVIEVFRDAIEYVITKKIDPDAEIVINADLENLDFKVLNTNGVVVADSHFENLKTYEEKVNESFSFIALSDAKNYDQEAKIDDVFPIQINLELFEQWLFTAIMHAFKQRISDIVRNNIYNRYYPLKNKVVTATITNKISAGYIFEIDQDKVAAFMPSHYASGKNLKIGDRMEVVIEDVTKNTRQSQIVVSSKSIQLVKEKIINSIPELQSKYLEIASIARIPGEKCKVAIRRTEEAEAKNISEVGSIIGSTGNRVFAISQELNGEKIEVIKYDADIAQFIVNGLAPARVVCIKEFRINNKVRRFTVIVPDFQHSLAIGRKGSNVKLTSDLTRSQLEILPYSLVLKENSFEIEWNGNIRDEAELFELKNEFLARQQTRDFQFSRHSSFTPNDTFSSILREFEADMIELERPSEQSFLNYSKSEGRNSNRDRSNASRNNSAKKSRGGVQNWSENSKNQDYFYESNEYGFNQNDQKSFFDADSLFDSALNQSAIENELIDKQHESAAVKPRVRTFSPKKEENEPTKSENPVIETVQQNENHFKNFKSDDDLINYAGVNDLDIDDFDF
ncbi:transcription termination/antitermination protein NusA [Mycoplasma sp. 'Moose RK']|uniref:transcription termination/antitermination protein NusA n=1 Tax=Mycoplasma sp. 'Moose RK' TaxID=2780095 RepID=UPI0018C34744|nr:transcription termination/antitermination protein NusA [Mycoplasma sp. 'Moose RK']MBG0731073.1 transcription termination/antitermination protein NusA [Mycoplasma sp. 'Moose RK']